MPFCGPKEKEPKGAIMPPKTGWLRPKVDMTDFRVFVRVVSKVFFEKIKLKSNPLAKMLPEICWVGRHSGCHILQKY